MNLTKCMQSFVRVVDHDGFAAAARSLHRSAPQISKEISWLEQELAVQLLIRTTRSLKLTEQGQQFYHYAKQSLQQYQEIKENLQTESAQISGQLAFTLAASLAEHWLLQPLTTFACKHPSIQLHIMTTHRFVDLITEQVDIGLRTITTNPAYQQHHFMDIQRGIFASPDYLEKYGTPKKPDDLNAHHAILYGEISQPNLWQFNNNQTIHVKMSHQCNNSPLLIHMAMQGLGCIRTGCYQVMNQLKNGSLIEVLKDYAPKATGLYLVYPKQDFIPAKTQAFIDFMLDFSQSNKSAN